MGVSAYTSSLSRQPNSTRACWSRATVQLADVTLQHAGDRQLVACRQVPPRLGRPASLWLSMRTKATEVGTFGGHTRLACSDHLCRRRRQQAAPI